MNFRVPAALIAISLVGAVVARTHVFGNPTGRSLMGQQAGNNSAKPLTPVLVELFTSEGCSSCPPADALLAQLGTRQPVNGAEAIILEEHVDYWDDQGWRDPFASKAATERQEEYAKTLSAEVYTPQMIVDGRTEILGSDEHAAERAIAKAIAGQKTDLELSWVGATATMGGPKLLRVRLGKLSGADSASTAQKHRSILGNHRKSFTFRCSPW